ALRTSPHPLPGRGGDDPVPDPPLTPRSPLLRPRERAGAPSAAGFARRELRRVLPGARGVDRLRRDAAARPGDRRGAGGGAEDPVAGAVPGGGAVAARVDARPGSAEARRRRIGRAGPV